MRNDPVLASRTIPDGSHSLDLKVYGGLHYIAGNSAPYFSLTCWYHRTGSQRLDEGGGASHDLILKWYPEFADLAALHLSDIDGVPGHAAANGYYWLAGAMGNPFGERFHGGGAGVTVRSPAECLKVFADHCRVSLEDAQTIADSVKRVTLDQPNGRNDFSKKLTATILDAMRPRWKREADACIAKHALVIYGDKWEAKK